MQRASAEPIIELPKWADPTDDWRESPNGMKSMVVGITGRDGARVRGLTIEIHAQVSRSVKRNKVVFGLFRDRERVYQLQIDDSKLFCHKDDRVGKLYGTHAHVGDEAEPCPVESAQWTFDDALEFFCRRINLTFVPPLSNPFEFRLK